MSDTFDDWYAEFKTANPSYRTMDRYSFALAAFNAGMASKPPRGAKYEGKRCPTCGGTVRYLSCHSCVNCISDHSTRQKAALKRRLSLSQPTAP